MPWPERSLVSIRQEFVLRAVASEQPFAELCREFGVSRKTGYKWLRRFRSKGLAGLVDESRRPTRSPMRISAEMVVELVHLKQTHRNWGAKKLWVLLARKHNADELPSLSTINRVLYHSGLVLRRRRYRPGSRGLPIRRPAVEVKGPNDLWTVDFKGWWRTTDGERCEPLTVRDAYSRFVLALRILPRTTTKHVRKAFEELFDQFGLPRAIQSDNGPPFASVRSLGGITELSAWWLALGIEVVRSRPGKPTDNGGHERVHADIRVEIQGNAARSIRAQQVVCDDWRTEFNYVRPHEAIGMKTPAELYQPSPRRPAGRIIVGGYPEDCDLLTVSNRGTIRTRDWLVYVSLALRNYRVGLRRTVEGYREVYFFDRLLGRFVPGRDPTVLPAVSRDPDEELPETRDSCHPRRSPTASPKQTRGAARKVTTAKGR